MVIVSVNPKIIESLKNSNFSTLFLDNCINSKFLAIEKSDSKIIGACFVGGSLNSNGIEILKDFRGKNIGKKLLNEILSECRIRKISFLTGVFKPSNVISIKTHIRIGYKPVFSVYYNKKEGREIVVINPFDKKGHFFYYLMRLFNTRIGGFFFSLLWTLSQPFLENLIAFPNNKTPKLEFLNSLKNFQKIEIILKQMNEELDL